MKRRFLFLMAMFLIANLLFMSSALAATAEEYAQSVVQYTNAERAERGLGALKLDSRLNELAKTLAMEQEGAKSMSGTRPGGEKWSSIFKEYGYSYAAGEAGCNWHSAKSQLSAQKLVDYWMGKDGFWQNVAYAGGFTHTGVYSYYSQKDRTYYTVQLFAKATGSNPLKAPDTASAAATSNVNVRAWPGTSYTKLGSLKKGQAVSVVKMLDNGWAQIDWNGRFAYVSGSYLRMVENTPAGGGSGTPSASGTATATGNVNVRSGPGTSYAKLGKLKTGQTVSVKAMLDGGWAQIDYNGRTAYVSTDYLRMPSTSDIVLDVPSTDPGTVGSAVATGNVNVRSGPGTSYSKLGKLKKGQTVAVWSVSGKWAEITWTSSSVKAYVHTDYLRFER